MKAPRCPDLSDKEKSSIEECSWRNSRQDRGRPGKSFFAPSRPRSPSYWRLPRKKNSPNPLSNMPAERIPVGLNPHASKQSAQRETRVSMSELPQVVTETKVYSDGELVYDALLERQTYGKEEENPNAAVSTSSSKKKIHMHHRLQIRHPKNDPSRVAFYLLCWDQASADRSGDQCYTQNFGTDIEGAISRFQLLFSRKTGFNFGPEPSMELERRPDFRLIKGSEISHNVLVRMSGFWFR